MFSIRSKVQNAVATPIPSYASFIDDNESSQSRTSHSKLNKSRTRKKRKKKRKASEIVNVNDYPSAKRRRISIVGVDVDPKKTKEIIQNKDFLLCEYHSNFPPFLVNQLKSIRNQDLNKAVSMKSCDNQWIIAKVHQSSNISMLSYWNTSSIDNNHNHDNIHNNHNISTDHHPNSPSKCYMIELNQCIIYDPDKFTEQRTENMCEIADIDHIHLLYPCASSFSTLKPHRAFKRNMNTNDTEYKRNNNNTNKYKNPFMPHSLHKTMNATTNRNEYNDLDDSIICPMFPSSTSRSITCISGVIFLSRDHKTLYIIPHDHVTTIGHETGDEHITYGINRNITYKVALNTNITQHNERIITTEILPQPRVGTHHPVNTYKILMGTTHGRLFCITMIINKDTAISKPSDVYFDHGTDLSSKVIIKDHEILFAFCNDNEDITNKENANANVGYLGFVFDRIKLGVAALSQVSMNGGLDADTQRLHVLRRSGLKFNTDIAIISICFGLNENCTKVIGYTLRKHSIDCMVFTEKECTLLWTFSLINIVNANDCTISISLLGQGLSVLTGFIDGEYGHALSVRLFKINTDPNGTSPLIIYGQCPIQLPSHIKIKDLHKLRYNSYWSYYNDKKTLDNEEDTMDDDADVEHMFQGQTSAAEFVEQRHDLRNDIICNQHHLVAPFGMIWSTDNDNDDGSPFITVFPLLNMDMDGNDDEIWDRIYADYGDLYRGIQLNNTCGPDGEHFNNRLVSTFELPSGGGLIPFYGGGCMLLPYHFDNEWKQEQMQRDEDDEKVIVEERTTNDAYSADKRKKLKQLSGGGYGYFMNDKYQVMRIKYSLQCAMARIHPDIEHYQQKRREEENKQMATMIRLAFSEFRNGSEGQPRANRLSHELLTANLSILSQNICKISESILDLKLFDTFSNSDVIQSTIKSVGFNTNKMRLGMNQIYIKLQTYSDFITFLKQSPSIEHEENIWHFIHNEAKRDMIQHREYLEIAHKLYNYLTNNEDDNDHYGHREDHSSDEDEDEEDDADDDQDDHNDRIDSDSRSSLSLSNFGDSNHNLYRQKYFSLKKGFLPKLLQCVIAKRGDIEYMNTYGNDENDTFFMRIAQIKQLLTELPPFLRQFLSHLTYNICNDQDTNHNNHNLYQFEYNEEIALLMKALTTYENIKIENERDELVFQLITIRISMEMVQCIINSATEYRLQHESLYRNIFGKYKATPWNYSNHIRAHLLQIIDIIVPYLGKIAPLLSSPSSTLNTTHRSHKLVIDTDNNYYDYILKKERNEIYRNLNEISRTIMESYSAELHLLKHQYQDHTGHDSLKQNFIQHRLLVIKHLYDLFPRNKSTNYDRWKTDLVFDSVHKIAFDYGECRYLVKLCDANNYCNVSQHNVLNICIQRFIDNLRKYKYEFMHFYFEEHTHNIDAFLCINIRKSDIWKTYHRDDIDIDALLNECISQYIAKNRNDNVSQSIIDEYCWIHNISIADYRNTASQLCGNMNTSNNNLDEQTLRLSMAKLSVFADIDDDDDDRDVEDMDDDIDDELLWLNAKQMLRSYCAHKDQNETILSTMSKRDIVESLMNECLLNERRCSTIEDVLLLIYKLKCSSLIGTFIENIIDCNSKEWQSLALMIDPKDRVEDNSMFQILNRTLVYEITKYLYDKKKQAEFIEEHHREDMMEDNLWELWSRGINGCATNKEHAKYYFTVRAVSYAQKSNDKTF